MTCVELLKIISNWEEDHLLPFQAEGHHSQARSLTMNFTALADCALDIDPLTYSCANPYPNCTNPAAFQFASLWVITQAIATCPNDTRLFRQTPYLTDASCRLFTHHKSWTPYPPADIWARLTTWKFPLLQLVAVFPRPPLTMLSELFVLVHLLGDPISSINNLLLKVASCQSRADFWKARFEDSTLMGHLLRTKNSFDDTAGAKEDVARRWKGLAAIVDSFDEWGTDVGTVAQGFILDRLTNPDVDEKDQRRFLELCRLTANALAADRSTKFLPIIVAQCFFIGTIAIAFGRTKDSAAGPNPPTFISIEAHSIAFSSLYFWIIPAVIISSIIGVSQTENAIPRILGRFRNEVHIQFPEWFPVWEMRLPHVDNMTTERRETNGGVYSWQPRESQALVIATIGRDDPYRVRQGPDCDCGRWHQLGRWQKFCWLMARGITLRPGSPAFSLVIFTYGALTGILISYLVPPVGFECRHVGEILISLAWVLSACLNNLPLFPQLHSDDEILATRARRSRFLFVLCKDIAVTLVTMGGIIFTQVGVFNQCACYTLWGRTGLALPEVAAVSKTLFWRINTSYPAISFICVGFQLIIVPCLLIRQYGYAIRVFLRRDDDNSNWPEWIVRVWSFLRAVWSSVGESLRRNRKRMVKRFQSPKRRSAGLITPTYAVNEHLVPAHSCTGKDPNLAQGEVFVQMDEFRGSYGSERRDSIGQHFPR